ncbi:uncharacterized protein [Diabrotica undecimpunctata]|uniref:uncharacterized protein n=1 Tax=Diabrotica undecimpunctata TaxID=50387 RepID=UPI003B63EE2B
MNILICTLLIATVLTEETPKKKRGLLLGGGGDALGHGGEFGGHKSELSLGGHDLGSSLGDNGLGSDIGGHGGFDGGFGRGIGGENGHVSHITLHKTVNVPVPQPYPVPVEKKIPYPVKVPVAIKVDKPYPVHVPKPYPVHIDKPYPVKIVKDVPFPVKVPYKVPVPVKVPVHIPKPYPVPVHKPVPVHVPDIQIVKKLFPVVIHSGHGSDSYSSSRLQYSGDHDSLGFGASNLGEHASFGGSGHFGSLSLSSSDFSSHDVSSSLGGYGHHSSDAMYGFLLEHKIVVSSANVAIVMTCHVALSPHQAKVHREKIGDYQQGFREDRSTTDAIQTVTQTNEKCHEHNIELIGRYKLFIEMKNQDIPAKLIRSTKMTMDGARAKVTTEEDSTKSIAIETGVRQGDSLSTTLFNMAVEETVKASKIKGTIAHHLTQIVAYADELILMGRYKEILKEAWHLHLFTMKILIFVSIFIFVCAEVEKKHQKRGLYDFGSFDHSYAGDFGHSDEHIKTLTITKKVPYPVPQPYAVPVTKHVPFPVKVPVKVPVDRPYPVIVPKPFPVVVEKPYPVIVNKHVPVPVKVPVKVPVLVPQPVSVLKPYPVTVHKPYPVKVAVPIVVEKKFPVFISKHKEHYF